MAMQILHARASFLQGNSAQQIRKSVSTRIAAPIGLKASISSRPARFNRSFTVRAEESSTSVSEPEVKEAKDALDPADGSVQYGAPLGEKGNDMLNDFGSVFSNPRSTEILNGRAAMIGFAAAIWFEVTKGTSLVNQIFNIKTFTLLDGNSTTVTYPGGGFYLAMLTVLVVITASYVPKAKGVQENGLDNEPAQDSSPLPRFTPDIEMFN